MARINRYVFRVGNKNKVICAYSEKQAKFLLINQAKANNQYVGGAKLIDITGLYPGDLISMWNVEQQQYIDIVI